MVNMFKVELLKKLMEEDSMLIKRDDVMKMILETEVPKNTYIGNGYFVSTEGKK